MMLAGTEGPIDMPAKKEIPEPNERIYAYTRDDSEAGTSKVVTCQLTIANKCALCYLIMGQLILLLRLCLLIV